MRVVFMGSSEASAECLRAILREPALEVVGVVTKPDRPAGRGKALTPCPLARFAEEHGLIDMIKPEHVNDDGPMEWIRAKKPDVIAVVAYGQILRKPLLDLPLCGCVNCHFSLLPKYRGAAPVVASLAAGDRMTGVSVIRMGKGMDDGPILMQSYEPIYSDVTGGELMDELAVAGGVTLAKALKLMNRNALPPEIVQVPEDATFAHKLKKTDGLVDWSAPVIVIERKIRAYTPWPGCYTFLPARFRRKGNSGRVAIARAEIVRNLSPEWRNAAPGTVLDCVTVRQKGRPEPGTGPVVKCGDTALMLTMLKPEGGSLLEGAEFLRGRQLVPGEDVLLQA